MKWIALLCLAQAHPGYAQNPRPLPNPNLQLVTNGWVNAVARLPDGSIVFGGSFDSANGVPRLNIAKLNPDGTLDSAWNPSAGGSVSALAADGSGNVYVGGQFTSIGGQSRRDLAKLSGSGAVDANWNPSPSIASFDDFVAALLVDTSGNVFVGGNFTAIGGQSRSNIAKLSGTGVGSADATWNASASGNVYALATDNGGNVYAGGQFTTCGGQSRSNIAKLSGTGTGAADANWNPAADATVEALAVDGSGNVFAGGKFTTIGGQTRSNIAKLSGTGTGAANASWNAVTSGEVVALGVDSSGNVYAGGSFATMGLQLRSNIAKLAGSGSGAADVNWNPSANGPVHALAVDSSGNVYAGGQFITLGGQQHLGLGQVSANGTTSPAMTDAEASVFGVTVTAAQPGGGIIVGGSFLKANQQPRGNLLRLNADGTLDSSWNPSANKDVQALAVDSNGDVYAGGLFSSMSGQARGGIAKLSGTGTGAVDANWNPAANNGVSVLAVDGSGNVYAAGTFTSIGGQPRFHLAKLSATGTGVVDPSWNPSPNANVYSIATDSSGNVYVGGFFFTLGGQSRRHIAKLSGSGTGAADATWNPSPNNEVDALAVDSNGDVYAGGPFATIGGQSRIGIAKLSGLGTGAADPAWNPSANSPVTDLAVDSGGNIYAGGKFTTIGGQSRRFVARLFGTGTGGADPNWNPSPDNFVYSLAVSSSDDVYVGGVFAAIGAQSRVGIAAFAAPPHITIASTAHSIVGQSYAVDVTVSAASGTPGGTVAITDDAVPANTCGPVALSNGTASCSITWNAAGTYQLTATYTPDTSSVFTPVSGTATHVVDPADQAITFTSSVPSSLVYGNAPPYSVAATASSGLGVAFSIDAASTAGTCSLSGNTVTFGNAGTCIVDADQSGNSNYNAAPQQQQSITVGKASQNISFDTQPPQTYAPGATFPLGPIASASSGLTVGYYAQDTGVCTILGTTVSIVSAGNCIIVAYQAGDDNFLAAPQQTQGIAIHPANQSIAGFAATPAHPTYASGGIFSVSATPGASGNALAFSAGPATVCTLGSTSANGAAVNIVGAGSCALTADQAGNGNYNTAPTASLDVIIAKAAQAIAFGAQRGHVYTPNGTFALNPLATASSGLAVSYSSLTTNVCTIGGTTINMIGAGTCTIAADQPGDDNYGSAQQATQDISIAKAATSVVLATQCVTSFVENQPFTVNATIGAGAATGGVTFRNGAAVLCNNVPLNSGLASCMAGDLAVVGTDPQDSYNLTADYGGDPNYVQSTSAPLAVTVLSAAEVVFRNGFEAPSPVCPIE